MTEPQAHEAQVLAEMQRQTKALEAIRGSVSFILVLMLASILLAVLLTLITHGA